MADETILVKVDYETDEAQKAVVDLTDDLFNLTEANKKLRDEQKKYKSNTEENIEVRKKLNRQIEANKDAIKRARKERNESIRVIKKEKSNFQKLGKTLKSAASSYLGVAAAIGIVIKGISSIINANVQFEQSLASLSAITGAIDDDLNFYADSAKEISKVTLQSATDIIKAFELVGSARPELLKNKEALAEVTKQAIILSEATGGKLGLVESAKAVTGVMNQMRQSSSEASRIINILAAGSKEGSANVQFLTEAFEKSGTSANLMGLSVEEVTGALEANAPFFDKASLLGNSFDKVLLKLRANQIGYASGTFNLNDAIDELRQKYENGTSAADIFGVEHAKLGELLVQNQGEFNTYTEAVTGTTTALEQQAIQNDTLGNNWKKLMNGIKNSFISSNISGLLNSAVKDMANSFDNLTKKIEHVKLGWQRLKGELTKEEYKQALDDLVNGVSEVNEVTEKGILLTEEETKATNKSAEAIKSKAQIAKELAEIEKKKDNERKERITRETFERKTELEAEKAFNEEIAEINKEIDEQDKERILELEQFQLESTQRVTDAEQAARERRRDIIMQSIAEVGMLANDFANFLISTNNSRLDKELAAEESKRDKALLLAGNDAAKKEKINADFEAKKTKLQKEAAKKNQKIQIANAIVQGAIVILNALATAPFIPLGLIAAAGAGIATALQIATIKQQSFAKGGQANLPRAARGMQMTTLTGATHAGGGVQLSADGVPFAEAQRDENVYVVNKDASDYINTLSSINQGIGGGVPLSKKSGHMASGGQGDVDTDQQPQDIDINDITERVIKNLPPIITRVESIKTGIEQFDEVIDVGVV